MAVKATQRWSAIASRGGLFTVMWWILSDAAVLSWWIGVPAVLLAVITSMVLLPPGPFVWYAFLKFVPFFLVRSLLGGVDVAWRALHPDLPIAPDLIEYPLRLPPGLPQVFMANTVSLLPGTLSAELSANCLKVHVLDGGKDIQSELRLLEHHMARMFAISLNAP